MRELGPKMNEENIVHEAGRGTWHNSRRREHDHYWDLSPYRALNDAVNRATPIGLRGLQSKLVDATLDIVWFTDSTADIAAGRTFDSFEDGSVPNRDFGGQAPR